MDPTGARLLLAAGESLEALDPATGNVLWSIDAKLPLSRPAVDKNGVLWAVNSQGVLQGIRTVDGEVVHRGSLELGADSGGLQWIRSQVCVTARAEVLVLRTDGVLFFTEGPVQRLSGVLRGFPMAGNMDCLEGTDKVVISSAEGVYLVDLRTVRRALSAPPEDLLGEVGSTFHVRLDGFDLVPADWPSAVERTIAPASP